MTTPQVCHLKQCLTDDEIDKIFELTKKLPEQDGGLSGGDNKSYRNVSVKAFDADDKNLEFVASIVSEFASTVNNKYWGFDIKGFAEPLQMLTYGISGHYDFHMDINWQSLNTMLPNRKITTIIQLSDTKDYQGGDLRLDVDNEDDFVIPRDKGDIVCFPSFLMHKVCPLTLGTRHSIVSWLSGDSWK